MKDYLICLLIAVVAAPIMHYVFLAMAYVVPIVIVAIAIAGGYERDGLRLKTKWKPGNNNDTR